MKNIIIATENMGKFKEIKALLGHNFDNFYSLRDFQDKVSVEEDSELYIENALKKARKIGDRFGMHTLADDSGLEVKALGGRPGVRSARYGKNDDDRIIKLLSELEGIPWDQREAVFKAYLAFYMPERERCYVFYGELRGIIGVEKHGQNGFGFDLSSLFLSSTNILLKFPWRKKPLKPPRKSHPGSHQLSSVKADKVSRLIN